MWQRIRNQQTGGDDLVGPAGDTLEIELFTDDDPDSEIDWSTGWSWSGTVRDAAGESVASFTCDDQSTATRLMVKARIEADDTAEWTSDLTYGIEGVNATVGTYEWAYGEIRPRARVA